MEFLDHNCSNIHPKVYQFVALGINQLFKNEDFNQTQIRTLSKLLLKEINNEKGRYIAQAMRCLLHSFHGPDADEYRPGLRPIVCTFIEAIKTVDADEEALIPLLDGVNFWLEEDYRFSLQESAKMIAERILHQNATVSQLALDIFVHNATQRCHEILQEIEFFQHLPTLLVQFEKKRKCRLYCLLGQHCNKGLASERQLSPILEILVDDLKQLSNFNVFFAFGYIILAVSHEDAIKLVLDFDCLTIFQKMMQIDRRKINFTDFMIIMRNILVVGNKIAANNECTYPFNPFAIRMAECGLLSTIKSNDVDPLFISEYFGEDFERYLLQKRCLNTKNAMKK